MTIKKYVEGELQKKIRNMHWEYMEDFLNVDKEIRLWAEEREPIKGMLYEDVRNLCTKAVENEAYIFNLEMEIESNGDVKCDSLKEILRDEYVFFHSEISRLRQLKFIIPLVQPVEL